MTNVVLRVTSDSYNQLAKSQKGILMEGLIHVPINFSVFILVLLYTDIALDNKGLTPLNEITTIFAANGAAAVVSFVTVLLTMIYSEGRRASESLRTNQPIGEFVRCDDEDELNYIYQFRNRPFMGFVSICPPVISSETNQSRQQLVSHLVRLNDAPVVIENYTLEDVADTEVLGLMTGVFHGTYLAVSTLWCINLKNSYAETALILTVMLLSAPLSALCFSKLFKAGISHYSSMPGNQFKGCFFSREAASMRLNTIDESLRIPLITNESANEFNA